MIYLSKSFNLALISLVFLSCSKETKEIKQMFPIDYYPLKIGNSYTFDVDSIVFDDFTKSVDTFKFQIQEIYIDTFIDITGNLAYKIERKKRNKIGNLTFSNWSNPQIWWVNLTSNQSIQRVENNLRFVNLVSPIQNGFTWNGNAFNILPDWQYRYSKVNETFENYDSTITVIQREIPENLIFKEYYEQKFAKNIGLIYYHFINVESSSNLTIPLMERIEKGVIYTQKLINFSTYP